MLDSVRRMRDPRALLKLAITLQILVIVFVHSIRTHSYEDTEVYRLAAQALLDGRDIYGELPTTSAGIELPFIYPPFAATGFVPLAFLPTWLAILLVAVLSHLALVLIAYVLVVAVPSLKPRAASTALAVTSVLPALTLVEPVRENLNYGQINLILLCMIATDCLLPGKRPRWLPRGLLVGLAAGIKLTPLAFLLFFLLRKDFRALGVTLATFSGTMILGFLAAPRASAGWWLHKMLSTGEEFGAWYAGNLTLRAALARFGLADGGVTIAWLATIMGTVVLAIGGMCYALRELSPAIALSLNGIAAALISPVSWSHHWVWIAPLLVLLSAEAWRRRAYVTLIGVVFAAIVFMLGPHWYVPRGQDAELRWAPFEHLIGNSYVLVGVAILSVMAGAWARAGGLRTSAQAPERDHLASSTR